MTNVICFFLCRYFFSLLSLNKVQLSRLNGFSGSGWPNLVSVE